MHIEINLMVVILLIILHFVGDFLLQSSYISKNKSENSYLLLAHVSIYSLPFMLIFSIEFGVVNGIAHFFVDYITSRISKKLWFDEKFSKFFILIGFDQMIHMLTLVMTYWFMFVR